MDGMPVPGTSLPESGDEIAGKYRIEGVLGQGGMGAVFSARNLMTGKRVAIKWLLPEHASGTSRERLLREARIACSVEHPNIVDIYDVGDHQGGLFLVMEYLRGKPLSDVLAERGRMDPAELIGLLIPAMRGVHAAHQAGVIHRDLKPENIILSEVDGQIVPKVVDFGVSKTVGASSVPHSSLTRTGALVGTPHYMALEQVDGSNLIDPRTDVYAFGVIIYRCLTGQFPFDGSSLGEVILKIGTKDPIPPRVLRPELHADLEAALLRSMSRSRDVRFRDLEEFARALEPFAPWVRFRESKDASGRMLGGPGGAQPVRMATPQEIALTQPATISVQGAAARDTPAVDAERARRKRAFWAGAGVALIVLLLGTALLLQRVSAPASQASHETPSARGGAAHAGAAVETQAPRTPASEKPVGSRGSAQAEPPTGADTKDEASPVEAASQERTPRGKNRPRADDDDRKARSPALIPGDRTKGLSEDDF